MWSGPSSPPWSHFLPPLAFLGHEQVKLSCDLGNLHLFSLFLGCHSPGVPVTHYIPSFRSLFRSECDQEAFLWPPLSLFIPLFWSTFSWTFIFLYSVSFYILAHSLIFPLRLQSSRGQELYFVHWYIPSAFNNALYLFVEWKGHFWR